MAVVRRKRNRQAPSRLSLRDTGENLLTSKQVRQMYDNYGFNNSLENLHRFIEALGIRLVSKPMKDSQSGFMHKEGDGWVVGVNNLHHPNRQRFTLAHELGHYFLHRNICKNFDDNYVFTRADEKSDPIEWEANRFAAEFLMPEDIFRQMVVKGVTSVDDIADQFGVSTMAVRIRAKTLGMQGHGLNEKI